MSVEGLGSVRTTRDPKKTIKAYKLMRLVDGKLYPLFIDSSVATEIGVWYDADSPDLSALRGKKAGHYYLMNNENEVVKTQKKKPSKADVLAVTKRGLRYMFIEQTEKRQKRFGENRKYWNIGINGSGTVSTFSMRPGWHAGSLPTMRQIGKGPNKDIRDDSFVWTEVYLSADIDYNPEAERNPDKDIPTHIPTDGYYMKATNADKKKSQADRVGWYVAGAMKIVRVIGDLEARQIIDDFNAKHPRQKKVEYDYERENGKVFSVERGLEGAKKADLKKADFLIEINLSPLPRTSVLPTANGFMSVLLRAANHGSTPCQTLRGLSTKVISFKDSIKAFEKKLKNWDKDPITNDFSLLLFLVVNMPNDSSRTGSYYFIEDGVFKIRYSEHNAVCDNMKEKNKYKVGITIKSMLEKDTFIPHKNVYYKENIYYKEGLTTDNIKDIITGIVEILKGNTYIFKCFDVRYSPSKEEYEKVYGDFSHPIEGVPSFNIENSVERGLEGAKSFSIENFCSTDKNRGSLCGVLHQKGFIYASNGFVAIKKKADYPVEREGKTFLTSIRHGKKCGLIDKKLSDKEALDVLNNPLPFRNANYESVIPVDQEACIKIDVDNALLMCDYAIACNRNTYYLPIADIYVRMNFQINENSKADPNQCKLFLQAMKEIGTNMVCFHNNIIFAKNGSEAAVLSRLMVKDYSSNGFNILTKDVGYYDGEVLGKQISFGDYMQEITEIVKEANEANGEHWPLSTKKELEKWFADVKLKYDNMNGIVSKKVIEKKGKADFDITDYCAKYSKKAGYRKPSIFGVHHNGDYKEATNNHAVIRVIEPSAEKGVFYETEQQLKDAWGASAFNSLSQDMVTTFLATPIEGKFPDVETIRLKDIKGSIRVDDVDDWIARAEVAIKFSDFWKGINGGPNSCIFLSAKGFNAWLNPDVFLLLLKGMKRIGSNKIDYLDNFSAIESSNGSGEFVAVMPIQQGEDKAVGVDIRTMTIDGRNIEDFIETAKSKHRNFVEEDVKKATNKHYEPFWNEKRVAAAEKSIKALEKQVEVWKKMKTKEAEIKEKPATNKGSEDVRKRNIKIKAKALRLRQMQIDSDKKAVGSINYIMY